MFLSQMFGDGGWVSSVLWMLMFFVMIFLYPRLMIYQITTKIENEVKNLENWSNEAVSIVWKSMNRKPKKEDKRK